MLLIMQIKKRLFLFLCLFIWLQAFACMASPIASHNASKPYHHEKTEIFVCPKGLYDQFPWAFTYYYGITGTDALVQIARGQFHRWPEYIMSFELAHTLSEENLVRRFFNPIVGVVQLAGNFAIRNGSNQPTIYEFDPYIAFRWANFPWNNYVNTSFAIGEGISYATSYPSVERRGNKHEEYNNKRLLNYLMLEGSFAAPRCPRLQLVLRVHHRSGVFGLYHAGNSGSNVIGLGIRYLFD
jgi:hypothetical protein